MSDYDGHDSYDRECEPRSASAVVGSLLGKLIDRALIALIILVKTRDSEAPLRIGLRLLIAFAFLLGFALPYLKFVAR